MGEILYKLNVIDISGNCYAVIGFGKDLRPTYESWRDATFEDSSKVILSGFGDDAERSPVEIAMTRDSIRGMILETY